MDTLAQDLRYAARRLVQSPGFTAVAIVTLALGIGANSAIFSVVHGILLKPLPYSEPERLVSVFHVSEGQRASISGPNFADLRILSRTLSSAAAVARSRTILTGQGEPVRLDGARVTASFFDVLGVQPVLGRAFRPEENRPGRTGVAMLGFGLWQQRFGADPRVIGQRITLDGVSCEVVGVMPAGFAFPADRVIWTPIEEDENFLVEQRASWYLMVIGRARPDVPLERVRAEIEAIGGQLAQQHPDSNEGVGLTAVRLRDAMVGEVRTAVLVLVGAVGFVLLIACVNVANLLLARAAARESEMAVRTALGAGRWRQVRQLLTESVLLAVAGGGLGLLLAVWGVDLLVTLQPQGVPRLVDVAVDTTVIAFTLVVAVVTGLGFGIAPAFQATRGGLAGSLRDGGRGALTSRGGSRLRGALVIVEMAVAVTLLAGAGLLIRSFTKLAAVDPGFRVEQVLTFELSLPQARYETDARQVGFFDRLLPRLHAIPGVESAAAVLALPLSGTSLILSFEVAGRPPVPPSQQPAMQVRVATPDYFPSMGIPLQRGRLFTHDDRDGSPPVLLLTEAAARQFFPAEDPIGQTITLGWGRGPGRPRAGGEVIGIVGDVKEAGLAEADPPQAYLAYRQWPVRSMVVVLKTTQPAARLGHAAAAAVHEIDPDLPVSAIRTLDQVVARSISQPRFYTTILGIFAGIALVLSAIGIFGVLSYAVAQRTREIGIRMALGAQRRTVVTLVVGQAMALAGGGLALGLVAASFLSQTLESLLFATPSRDPLTLAVVAALLLVVSLLASYVPACRATRVDPLVALRTG